jgi:plasmid stabilization system protein ParE
MTYHVVITQRAERDMSAAVSWWAAERSVEQAKRWLAGLDQELQTLARSPERCPLAAENGQFPHQLRELHYGLSRRPTHRAIFTVADDLVLVLAVRHGAQDLLRPEDLI